MKLTIPTVTFLKTRGKFHSYILPGHYEVWRLGKLLYVIIDGVTRGKYWQYVEEFHPKEEIKHWAGFHPFDGEPCAKE